MSGTRSTVPRIDRSITFLITAIGNQGGAEASLVALATGLRARGWRVHVVSLRTPSDAAKVDRLTAKGIAVETLGLDGPTDLPGGTIKLIRILRASAPDVLHTHMVHANLLGRAVRPLARVPVLVSAARNSYEGPRWRTWAYRVTDRWCEVTVQVSERAAEQSVRTGAVPGSKIRVIPNGVDVHRFERPSEPRESVRRSYRSEDSFVWVAVGRLMEAKDYGNALEAISRLRGRGSVVLWIAGDGELREQLEQRAEELGVAGQIRFLGFQRDVVRLLRAADAYLMSSAWEGMPNALLEAAAAGLPLVATDVGGNSDIVIDGETGFLAPPRDPAALATCMARVMSMPVEVRAEMGRAAHEHVRTHFSLERMVDRWENLYIELMANRKSLSENIDVVEAATIAEPIGVEGARAEE